MQRVFWGLALCFVAAAIFHAAAIVVPSLAGASPPWRHGLFALVNALVAIGLVRRPRGFVLAFALLTAQQLLSHGRDVVVEWEGAHQVDWASVMVVVVMPIVLFLLVRDARVPQTPRG